MPEDRESSPNPQPTDWRELAKRVVTETDPDKLAPLVDQLCDALEKTRLQDLRQPALKPQNQNC